MGQGEEQTKGACFRIFPGLNQRDTCVNALADHVERPKQKIQKLPNENEDALVAKRKINAFQIDGQRAKRADKATKLLVLRANTVISGLKWNPSLFHAVKRRLRSWNIFSNQPRRNRECGADYVI